MKNEISRLQIVAVEITTNGMMLLKDWKFYKSYEPWTPGRIFSVLSLTHRLWKPVTEVRREDPTEPTDTEQDDQMSDEWGV